MNDLLYSEWLVLKNLQDKTMTLQELHQSTTLDKGLLIQVLSSLIKMNRVHAARGIFRARVKVSEDNRQDHWGQTLVQMINESYRASIKDLIPTTA